MSRQPQSADIHQAIVDLARSGRPFALAVVLKDAGSTPRKAGTKALIESDGSIHGTVGGGAVEAETQRRAVEAIRSGHSLVFDSALEGADAKDHRPICGGTMRILIDPGAGNCQAVYAQAAEARRLRRHGVLLTSVRVSRQPQVAVEWLPEESLPGGDGFPDSEAIRSAVAAQAPRLFVKDLAQEGGQLEALVEPLILPPLLLIAGGGHVGQALALQAGLVGFQVVVIDDRSEFADPALYPRDVATRCGDIARELADFPIADDTYVVVVTRGHQNDQRALAACIRRPAAYLGMIGSKRKVAMIRKDLLASGAAGEEEFGRVYAPIGLDIGAQTVPEIATSIVAQLIAVLRKGTAPRMAAT